MNELVFDERADWILWGDPEQEVLRGGSTNLPPEFRQMFLDIAKDTDKGEIQLLAWMQIPMPDKYDADVFIEIAYMDCPSLRCGCPKNVEKWESAIRECPSDAFAVRNWEVAKQAKDWEHKPWLAGYGCNSLTGKVSCYVN